MLEDGVVQDGPRQQRPTGREINMARTFRNIAGSHISNFPAGKQWRFNFVRFEKSISSNVRDIWIQKGPAISLCLYEILEIYKPHQPSYLSPNIKTTFS